MIIPIVLAQLYGVLQLAVLAWAACTVRLRVLLLAALWRTNEGKARGFAKLGYDVQTGAGRQTAA